METALNGNWSGMMLDGEGFQARSSLNIEVSRQEIKGSVKFQLVKEHEPGKEQTGEVRGSVDEAGDIKLQYRLAQQGVVTFEGRVLKVRYHARAAICGTYRVGEEKQEPLAGGVAIFWLFAEGK